MRPSVSPALVCFTRTSPDISSLAYAMEVAVLGGEMGGVIETIAARAPAVVAPE